MADQNVASTWTSLPQGVLQVLGSTLFRRDCLTCRLVCKSWRIALGDLIEHLRIHVAAGCRNAAPQGPSVQKLVQQALHLFKQVSSVTLVLTQYTTGTDLAEALQVLESQEQVKELILWETECYSARPRPYAACLYKLDLSHLQRLVIRSPVTWNLQDIWHQICSVDARGHTTASNTGARLPRLQSLEIPKVALRHYRQQTCTLPVSTLEPKPPSDCKGLLPQQQAILPNLHHLVTPLPGQHDESGAVVCTLMASHDSYLRSLAGSLPELQSLTVLDCYEGDPLVLQRFAQLTELHANVGALFRCTTDSAEEESFISKPLLSLKNLQQLDITGYHGAKTSFKLEWLTALPQLEHLTACITQSSQGIAHVRPDQLKTLCTMQVPKASEVLSQIAAVGSGLTALTLSTAGLGAFENTLAHSYRRNSISLQPYLTTLQNLQNLTLMSGVEHLVFTIRDPPAVWEAMPNLTRLKLQGVGLELTMLLNGLHIVGDSVVVLHYTAGYTEQGRLSHDRTNMHRNSTPQPSVRTHHSSVFTDCLPVWVQDLPQGLKELELSRYMLVLPQLSQPVQQQPSESSQLARLSASACGCTRSNQKEHPLCLLQGLQKLVLSACCAVVAPQLHAGPMIAGARDSADDSLDRACSMSSATVRSPQHIDVMSRQLSYQQREQPSGGSMPLGGVHNSDISAVAVPIWQLLCLLGTEPQLRDLQLLKLFVCEADLTYIANHLGAGLQTLRLHAASWHLSAAKEYLRAAIMSPSILSAAAKTGKLQQLATLELMFAKPPYAEVWPDPALQCCAGCGVDACHWLCESLGSLKRLKLGMTLQCHTPPAEFYNRCGGWYPGWARQPDSFHQVLGSGTIRASEQYECFRVPHALGTTTTTSSESNKQQSTGGLLSSLCSCNATWDLSSWQHLQVLNAKLSVPPMHNLGDLGHGTVGRCQHCGGAVGLEACEWFFMDRLKDLLPCCEVTFEQIGG